jgi:hypothetical protein
MHVAASVSRPHCRAVTALQLSSTDLVAPYGADRTVEAQAAQSALVELSRTTASVLSTPSQGCDSAALQITQRCRSPVRPPRMMRGDQSCFSTVGVDCAGRGLSVQCNGQLFEHVVTGL